MKSRQSKQNNLLPPSPTRLSSRSVSVTEENKIFVGGGGGGMLRFAEYLFFRSFLYYKLMGFGRSTWVLCCSNQIRLIATIGESKISSPAHKKESFEESLL